MTLAVALALGLVALVVGAVPVLLARGRPASPRLVAATHLVSLLGVALLPVGAAVCAVVDLVQVSGQLVLRTACAAAVAGGGVWVALPVAVGVAGLAPLIWHGARLLVASRRTELTPVALAGARRRRVRSGGVVWVLPAAEPAAHTCGLRHPHAVVTSGLLNLLGPAEQQAVCEHEAAHLRLGHPRLLVAAATVGRAYGFLPPVRRAWSGLRRELEAAADDEAVRAVGAAPLLTALARVALAPAPGAAAGFADPEHLRYRLSRLQRPPPPDRRAGALAAVVGIVLIAGFTWMVCAVATGVPAVEGVVMCTVTLAGVAVRPLWPTRRVRIAAEHGTP